MSASLCLNAATVVIAGPAPRPRGACTSRSHDHRVGPAKTTGASLFPAAITSTIATVATIAIAVTVAIATAATRIRPAGP